MESLPTRTPSQHGRPARSAGGAGRRKLSERLAQLESAIVAVGEQLRMMRFPLPAPLLKVSEVCRILRVSEASVRRYIASGELRSLALVLGRVTAHRVRPEDLKAFLDFRTARRSQNEATPPRLLRVPKVTPFD